MEILINLINEHLIPFGLDLLFAVLVLLIGFAVTKWLLKLLHKSKLFERLDTNAQTFINNSIDVILKLIIFITAIVILGVPQASIVAVLGSCGLALGLALQGGLSNIASGVIIMFCKPFHVGDYIISGSISGVVKNIGLYYTLITTPDNQDISVPNSSLANSTISNLSTEAFRRLDFDFKISYDSDIDLTRKVLLATAQMNDLISKETAPEVFVAEHGDSSITMKLRVWCKAEDYWTVYFDMWEDVKKAFDKFEIEIPYNYVNVVMKDSEKK